MKILLVEDDELIAQGLAKAFTDQHYTVDLAADGKAGWELVESFTYDLILLDLGLPKLDGISFCRRLRSQGNQTPVLLLTAQDTSTNKVMGLDAGADDYVAKPFNLPELLARIRALLRRGGAALPPLLEWRNLKLDPSTCEVTCNNQPLRLTPKEYGLLELFLRTPHRIFSSGALIEHLWSFEEPPTEDTVRSHLKGLRQKLKAAGIAENPIETVYGIGYRLKAVGKDSKDAENNKKKQKNPKSSSAAALSKIQNPKSKIQNQTEIGVQNIWQQVKETMNQRVSAIAQATTMVLQDRLSEELRSEAHREAHKLAGSLGMFGSDKGSLLAKEIESLFESGVRLKNHQALHLSELVAALRKELQRMDKEQMPESQPVPQSPQANASKVMVVDDDPLVLTALQNLLEPWGFQVYTLGDPLQFFDLLKAAEPDLLILDVEMPHKGGIELCREIRNNSQWSGLPILFLTARTDAQTMHQVFAAGADDYVNKPIVGPELVSRILNRLERTRLLRSLVEIDALTGIANRRKSFEELQRLIQLCDRHPQPFCFAIVDLDELKRINHQHGYAAGDEVLSRLGELLRRNFSNKEIIGRWGGTEFVVGMAGIAKNQGKQRLFEVLQSLRQHEFTDIHGNVFQATFSAAVVQYPQEGEDLPALYQAADTILEQAKATGRNQVLSRKEV